MHIKRIKGRAYLYENRGGRTIYHGPVEPVRRSKKRSPVAFGISFTRAIGREFGPPSPHEAKPTTKSAGDVILEKTGLRTADEFPADYQEAMSQYKSAARLSGASSISSSESAPPSEQSSTSGEE